MSFFCIGSALGLDKRVAFTRKLNGICISDIRRFPYERSNRLIPIFHRGPADLSNLSIENGFGIEDIVTKTGESIRIADAANDLRFERRYYEIKIIERFLHALLPLQGGI